jgi:hypothetical protein
LLIDGSLMAPFVEFLSGSGVTATRQRQSMFNFCCGAT